MHKIFSYLLLMGLIVSASGVYAQIITQNFATFADSSDLATNAPWRSAFGGGTLFVPKTKINPYKLQYGNYLPSIVGKSIQITPDGDGPALDFAVQNTGTMYVAFSIKISNAVQTTSNVGDFVRLCGGNDFTTATRIYAQKQGTKIRFGIDKNSAGTQYTAANYDIDSTFLVVLKYTFNPGTADDQVKLYIDPNTNVEPTTAQLTNTTGTDVTTIDRLIVRANSASTPTARIGCINIANSWIELLGNIGSTYPVSSNGLIVNQLRYNKNILACTISATNAQTATAQLTNAEGKTIYNTNAFEITETPTPIAIAINKKLSNGIYFVRVITQDGKQITQKMMVND
jgi:hypothetical protein